MKIINQLVAPSVDATDYTSPDKRFSLKNHILLQVFQIKLANRIATILLGRKGLVKQHLHSIFKMMSLEI